MDFVERLFWTLAIFFGVHFVWLAWIEGVVPLPYGTALAAVLALGFFAFAWRFMPFEEQE